MTRKVYRVSHKQALRAEFNSNEFLLLAFAAFFFLTFVIWQMNLLSKFIIGPLVLGMSTVR